MAEFPNKIIFFLLNDSINPINIPKLNINIIFIFINIGINIICCGLIIHVNIVPDIIVSIIINEMGVKDELLMWFFESELDFIENLLDKIDIRSEYIAVNPIEIIIIYDKMVSILNEIMFSKIASFEKNPEEKGKAIKVILVIPRIEDVIGVFIIKLFPIFRISWYEDSWIIIPAHKNIVDLNNAWIIKWKNAIIVDLMEIANIIIAIWLKVDKAIIFFISNSQLADIPA